jgi:hypothetical protein
MPFVTPTLSDSFGSRIGTTGIQGSLNPTSDNGLFTIGADIGAGPPFGVITTTTSWGFNAGIAPPGATTLVVTVNGVTDEGAQTFAAGPANSASADAELSITIEEFRRMFRPPSHRANLVRIQSVTGNNTSFIHIWSAVLGLQFHRRRFVPFSPVGVIAVTPGLFYRCWFNAVQSAACVGVSGGAGARCSFQFGMTTPFFAFN